MKKRFAFLSIIVLMLSLVLTGCNGTFPGLGGNSTIDNIEIKDQPDAEINFNSKMITFEVATEVSTFNVESIKATAGDLITIKAYDTDGKELGNELALQEGDNSFNIVFQIGDFKEDWKLIITRVKPGLIEKKVKEISVAEFKTTYLLGEQFVCGKLNVLYDDGSKKVVDITANMLDGFDTTTEGNKTVTISFAGKTTTININVTKTPSPKPNEDSVTLFEFQTEYTVGDAFKGGRLQVVKNGNISYVNITTAMLTGFDTKAAGTKSVTITYNGYVFAIDINVKAQEVIEPTTLSEASIKRFASSVVTIGVMRDYENNYDEAYEAVLKTVPEDFVPQFKEWVEPTGFTNEELDKASEIIKTKVAPITANVYNAFDSGEYPDDFRPLVQYLLSFTKNDVEDIQNTIKEILTILKPEKLARLIPDEIKHGYINNSSSYYNKIYVYNFITQEFENKGFYEILNDPKYKDILNQINSEDETVVARTTLNSRIAAIKDFASIFNTIASYSSDEIVAVIDMLKNPIEPAGYYELYTKAYGLINEIFKNSNNFNNLFNLAYELIDSFVIDLSVKGEMQIIINLVKKVQPYIPELLKALDLSAVDFTAVMTVINTLNGPAPTEEELLNFTRSIVVIAKKLLPLVQKISKDAPLINELDSFLAISMQLAKGSVQSILNVVKDLAKFNPLKMTMEDAQKVMDLINNLTVGPQSLVIYYNDDIILNPNMSLNDILALFNENVEISDFTGNMIQITNEILGAFVDDLKESLKTCGTHILYFEYQGSILAIPYAVVEENANVEVYLDEEFYYSMLNTIFYVDENGKILGKNRYYGRFGKLEEYSRMNCSYYLNYLDYGFVSYYRESVDITLVDPTKKDGINLIEAICNIRGQEIKLLTQYHMLTNTDDAIIIKNNKLAYNVPMNGHNYYYESQITKDWGYKILSDINIAIEELRFTEKGPHDVVLTDIANNENYNLTVNALDDNEAEIISYINYNQSEYIYPEDCDRMFQNNLIYLNGANKTLNNFTESNAYLLNRLMKEFPNAKNLSLKLSYIKKINDNKSEFKLECLDGTEVLREFVFSSYTMTAEEYHAPLISCQENKDLVIFLDIDEFKNLSCSSNDLISEFIKNRLNTLKFSLSYIDGNESVVKTNIFSYLDSINMEYFIEIYQRNGYIEYYVNFNRTSINGLILTEAALVQSGSLSISYQNLYGVLISTTDTPLDVLNKIKYRVKLEIRMNGNYYTFTGDKLVSLAGSYLHLSLENRGDMVALVIESDNSYTTVTNLHYIDDVKLIAQADDNLCTLIYDSTVRVPYIKNLLDRNLINLRLEAPFSTNQINLDMVEIEIIKQEFLNESFNIDVKFSYEGLTAVANLNLPKCQKDTMCSVYPRRHIIVDDINNIKREEIIAYSNIATIDYSHVLGLDVLDLVADNIITVTKNPTLPHEYKIIVEAQGLSQKDEFYSKIFPKEQKDMPYDIQINPKASSTMDNTNGVTGFINFDENDLSNLNQFFVNNVSGYIITCDGLRHSGNELEKYISSVSFNGTNFTYLIETINGDYSVTFRDFKEATGVMHFNLNINNNRITNPTLEEIAKQINVIRLYDESGETMLKDPTEIMEYLNSVETNIEVNDDEVIFTIKYNDKLDAIYTSIFYITIK